jgi:hypothetical protein
VIDEAQNLEIRAIEELRMLSNFQLGTQSLLQSFLVGQPELRKKLESQEMEQLRQRVTASCHLGPLGLEETRGYIEHRLRRVGWANRPRFEDPAFDEIYRWTGGVPRRINRLCNRLLLAAFLEGREDIASAMVESTALELRQEIGEAAFEPLALPRRVVQPSQVETALALEAASTVANSLVDVVPAELPQADPVEAALPAQDVAAVSVQTTEPLAPTEPTDALAAALDAGSAKREPAVAASELMSPAPEDAPAAAAVGVAALTPRATEMSEGVQHSVEEVPAPLAASSIADAPSPEVMPELLLHAPAAQADSVVVAPRSPILRTQSVVLKPRLGVLLCLADSTAAALKLAAIGKAMDALDAAPRLVLVNPGQPGDAWPWEEMESLLPAPDIAVHLGVPLGSVESSAAALFERFGAVIDEFSPLGVVSLGSSDALLACNLMAHKRNLPVLRLEAGDRSRLVGDEALNATLIEQMSDVLLSPNSQEAHQQLYRSGIAFEKVFGVSGRLAVDVIGAVLPSMTTPYGAFLRHRLPIFLGPRWSSEVDGTAYAVVTLQLDAAYLRGVAGLLDVLVDLHAVPKLLWLTDATTREAIRQWQASTPSRADDIFIIEDTLPRAMLDRRNSARILCSDIRSLSDQLSILRGAVAVLAEPGHVLTEAAPLLGIPSITLDAGRLGLVLGGDNAVLDRPWGSVSLNDYLAQAVSRGDPPVPTDGLPAQPQAAAVIASRLRAWAQRRLEAARMPTKAVVSFRRAARRRSAGDRETLAA